MVDVFRAATRSAAAPPYAIFKSSQHHVASGQKLTKRIETRRAPILELQSTNPRFPPPPAGGYKHEKKILGQFSTQIRRASRQLQGARPGRIAATHDERGGARAAPRGELRSHRRDARARRRVGGPREPRRLHLGTSRRRGTRWTNTRRGRWLAVAALTLGAAGACAAVVGANGGVPGVFSALGDAASAVAAVSDGGAWGFAPAADRLGLGAGVDASAWDAGIAGTARAPWLGAGTFVAPMPASADASATPDWIRSLMPSSSAERSATRLAAPTGESRRGAAGWSGRARARVSELTPRAVNGDEGADAADEGAEEGAEGADAAAESAAEGADEGATPLGKAERDAASGSTEKREKIAFRVNVCGIPPVMRQNQAPWPVCRVWLVGCPGGAPCGIRSDDRPNGVDSPVTGVDPPSGHGALDPRRPLGVRTRHRRARARGRVRVHDRQAVVHGRAARRRGRRGGRVPRSHRPVRGAVRQRAPDGKSRPKPGSKRGDVLAGATGSSGVLGTLGTRVGTAVGTALGTSTRTSSSFTPVTNSPTELARLGSGDAVCVSRSPTSPDSGACVLRRGLHDPLNTFRRVLPPKEDELVNGDTSRPRV